MSLTADRNTSYKDDDIVNLPVKASTKIFAGALVAVIAGYAQGGVTALSQVAMGRAEEQVDNSAGADGDLTVNVRRGKQFKFANSGGDALAQADVGATCYIEDDQTVAKTSTGKSVAGLVMAVDSDGVWVFIG